MVAEELQGHALSWAMLLEQVPFEFDAAPALADRTQIRFSARARRLSVRVHRSGRVEVVAPVRTSARRVAAFVAEHRNWIEAQRARIRDLLPPPSPFPPREIILPAVGEAWRLHIAGGTGSVRIRPVAGQMLRVTGPIDAQALRVALRRWLVRHAAAHAEPWLRSLAETMGAPYRRLALRFQRSRWGSCSARGTISLNAALLFQRREVAHYLMIHELAHLHQPNHSTQFWAKVQEHCADWRRLDRELAQGWRQVPAWVFA